jgi:hypothetical protein
VKPASPSSQAIAGTATDFGVRLVLSKSRSGPLIPVAVGTELGSQSVLPGLPLRAASSDLSRANSSAANMGRVTSTYRSPTRKRIVGGGRNSYHLSGRALDVVPRSGVRHRQIEAALLIAGYRLRKSLDEGDHSHFVFEFGTERIAKGVRTPALTPTATQWKIVYAPGTIPLRHAVAELTVEADQSRRSSSSADQAPAESH